MPFEEIMILEFTQYLKSNKALSLICASSKHIPCGNSMSMICAFNSIENKHA